MIPMNRLRSSALLIAGLACLLAGCRSGKVLREDFSQLQRIEIQDAGISFLFLPGKIRSEDRQEKLVFALVNPVDEYPALGQDARFMMQLLFRNVESPMVAEKVGKGVLIHHGDGAPAADLEIALRCSDGNLWLAEIRVYRYSIDGHEYFEEDIEIARRILESVECIPVETSPDGGTEH